MKKILVANCGPLVRYPKDDVRIWAGIHSFVPLNASLVDRMGSFRSPFHFELDENLKLPTDIEAFKDTYEECCSRRVQEILDIQQQSQKPVALLYSGGIDSTLVLVSFAKILGSELKSRVKVFLSSDSIKENPRFYYSFIRKNCTIESSERFSYLFDQSHIIVSGEHNDQLFGSDVIGKISKLTSFEDTKLPYSRDLITRFFTLQGMEKQPANIWFDILSEHARQAPCAIETVYDFFWWLNFVFKWQAVYFRTLLRINKEQYANINQAFLDTYYQPFFNTPDFQRWAIVNTAFKIKDTWKSYKFPAKELIYDFNKDKDYFENKAKAGSLSRLFVQKNTAEALTSDYEFLPALRPDDFYNPENSFSTNACS